MAELKNEVNPVPAGIKNEIGMHFDNVTYELDSDITENTVTRKLHYREIGENVEDGIVMDPTTFETKTISGYRTRSYMVRYDVDGSDCIVRRVLMSGEVITPEK